MLRRQWLDNLLLAFGFGAAFFLAITLASNSIASGDDAYRHVRFANRLVTELRSALADPWRLPLFWPKPLDVWFGYHLLLAPLTLVLPLIPAAKLMGAVVWGCTAVALHQMMAFLGVRWSRAWIVLAMAGSGIVVYRATLVRPFLLSILLMILVVRYVAQERVVPLAVASLLHALSYSMFFLPALPVGLYVFIRRDRRSLVLAAACALGLVLGLVANPYFPENVKFSLAQALTPITADAADQLDIGMEVRPINAGWLATTLPVFAVWLPAAAVLAFKFRKEPPSPAKWLLFWMSLLLLAGSFRVSRTLDLFVPFAVLFAASVLSPWIAANREKAQFAFALLYLVSAAVLIPAFSTLRAAPPIHRYEGAARFLARDPNTLVFNTHWEQYPFLYFWNWHSLYVTGIDPTFLYSNSRNRYWLWRHVSDDVLPTCPEPDCARSAPVKLEDVFMREFGARYVLVERNKNPKLTDSLRASRKLKEAYQDSDISVFEVLEASLDP